jgi:hypothetical protein
MDVFVYDVAIFAKHESSPEISANKMDAVLIDWVNTGQIVFDRSGVINTFKERTKGVIPKIHVAISEMESFEANINSAYITNKRYFDSGKSEYLNSLEIKLLRDVYYVFLGYFEFRDIPFRGEKKMMQYLETNDANFYNLMISYSTALDLKSRFEIYSKMIDIVFYGKYTKWSNNVISPTIMGGGDQNSKKQAIEYWNKLIS